MAKFLKMSSRSTKLKDSVEAAVIQSLESVSHFDVAMVAFELYKSSYVVTNIKSRTWFVFKEHIWEQSEIGPYRELSSEVLHIFKKYLKSLKSSKQKHLTKISNCEKVICMLMDTVQKERVCHECLYVFYDNGFLRCLDLSNNLIPFQNGVYNWIDRSFRDGLSSDMLSIYVNEPFEEGKCYDELIKEFVKFRMKLVNSRTQDYDYSYRFK